MVVMEGDPASARQRLLRSAEELISRHGAAVPLRQVVQSAGQRNNAAVRYHFGARDDLIAAVIADRQSILENRRLQLLDESERAGRADLVSLVRVLMQPVFEMQRDEPDCHHARFMEKVRDIPGVASVEDHDWPATAIVLRRIRQCLGTPQQQASREEATMRTVATVVLSLLADLERLPTGADRVQAEAIAVDAVVAVINATGAR